MECKDRSDAIDWRHFVGIFLLSLATLLLELSLTRVLSLALWYHFGFLVISTALLGFGASGVVLITPNKNPPPQAPLYTAWNTFSKVDLYESPPRMETDGRAGRVFMFDSGTAWVSL